MNKYRHYFRPCPYKEVDIYRVCALFNVDDPSGAIHHAIKKLLVPGVRGTKPQAQDIREARDTLNRKLEMMLEDEAVQAANPASFLNAANLAVSAGMLAREGNNVMTGGVRDDGVGCQGK